MSNSWKSSDRVLQIIILIAVLLVGAILGASGWLLITNPKSGENAAVVLPLLTIGGLLSLLIVLALVSVFFQTLGLANKEQALALPEGSVRAVIALGLIVLFAILAIYLYGSISARMPDVKNPVADDFAKQLLTIMGTLVTAVASFYFGANTVASAHKAATEAERSGASALAPTINPPSPASSGPGSVDLKISGSNLNPITRVMLVQGPTQIVAEEVKSNAQEVTCKVTIDANAPKGKYNVVVSNEDGKVKAELANAFEVT
jgi:hypothetical protein